MQIKAKMQKLHDRINSNKKLGKIILCCVMAFSFLYVFSIPSFSGRSGWNYISYGLMALLAIFTAFYVLFYKGLYFNKFLIVIPCFVAWAFIGTAIYSHEFRGWLTLALMCLTMFVLYYAFSSIGKPNLIILFIVIAFTLFCIYFLIIYKNNIINTLKSTTNSGRLGAYFDNQNTIGQYMTLLSILSIYLMLFLKNKVKYLLIISLAFGLFVGYLSGSRTFIITFSLALIILFFFKLKNHKLIYFIILAVLIALFIIIINLPFMSFLKSQFDRAIFSLFGIGNAGTQTDGSTIYRLEWQLYGFNLCSKNSIFGYGYYGFGIYSGVGTYTHGNLAEMLCDYGIVGTVIFYAAIIGMIVLGIISKKSPLNYLMVTFGIYYLIASFGSVFYYAKPFYVIFAMLLSFFYTKGFFVIKNVTKTNNIYEVNL